MTDEPRKKDSMPIALIVGLVIVAIVIAFALRERQAALNPGQPNHNVTMAQYQMLRTGMTYSQAVEILRSPGVETAHSEMAGIVTVMYAWQGDDTGANMSAMFQNDKLITKAQYGLK
jgi:hypothetical protein